MPLNMTKVAYGAQSLDEVHGWFEARAACTSGAPSGDPSGGQARLTTRNLPRRHAEMIGGSVYWILKHQLVARSEIIGFAPAPDGRTDIIIRARLIDVHPRPRRAHQGWRYLEPGDAPPDLGEGETADVMPANLAGELAKLGLV